MNALVMYDHQTDTLWSQFLSRGVKGPLTDTTLEIVPAIQTTWRQWLELHPDTLVLDKRGRYQKDRYEGYYRGASAGILGESNRDNRLPSKELVIGLDLDGAAKAYSFQAIANQKVINDTLAGDDVVVTFDPTSETGAVFKRQIEGRSLTFQLLTNETADGIMLMQDRETGSLWQTVTGRAVGGPLAGQALTRLPSHYSFWFAWTDFHPDTELYVGS